MGDADRRREKPESKNEKPKPFNPRKAFPLYYRIKDKVTEYIKPGEALAAGAVITTLVYFVVQTALLMDSNHHICPRVMVCAETPKQVTFLFLSRSCVGFIYPGLIVLFATKMNYLKAFLSRTWLSEIIDFSESHLGHRFFGIVVFVSGTLHAIFHTIRLLALRGQYHDYTHHPTGWSGIVGTIIIILISVTMMFGTIKSWVSFEIRKSLHYLFIAFMAIMARHAPRMQTITLTVLFIYLADYVLNMLFKTYQINDAEFEPVGKGVAVSFRIPEGMRHDPGQYIYLNIPWVSTYQWHAFSLIVDDSKKDNIRGSLYIMGVGNFTTKLYSFSAVDKDRPVMWINGPHPSPFMHSVQYNNLIMIATGAGITPAISVASKLHKQRNRNLHLLFLTKDADLAKFFYKVLGKIQTTIFYTGSADEFEKLESDITRKTIFSHDLDEKDVSVSEDEEALLGGRMHYVRESSRWGPSIPHGAGMELEAVPESEEIVRGAPDLKDKLKAGATTELATMPSPAEGHQSRPPLKHKLSLGVMTKAANVELVNGKPDLHEELSEIILREEKVKVKEAEKKELRVRPSFLSEEIARERHERIANTKSEWCVLYCGASKKLNATLEEVTEQLGVRYLSEYFDSW